MNNLFITGPVQTGKSTLIRNTIGEHINLAGGFSCQRLLEDLHAPASRPVAFRLAPPEEPTTGLYSPHLPGIFKCLKEGNSFRDNRVFQSEGVRLLERAVSDYNRGLISFVLLDEIGGQELTCGEFRTALYSILQSGIPCLGVLKHIESTRKMVRKMPEMEASQIISLNLELNKKITGPENEHGEILYFDRNLSDGQEIALKIESFLNHFTITQLP